MYLKVEGTGGGSSGSGIIKIIIYDEEDQIIRLTKKDIVAHNATARTSDEAFNRMLQASTVGEFEPYNGNKNLIYYILKLPSDLRFIKKIYIQNWTNGSYNIDRITISLSKDNINYQKIYSEQYNVSEYKEILHNYVLIEDVMFVSKDSSFYSFEKNELLYEPKMTSNTTPSPYVASASSLWNSNYPAYRAFNGTRGGNYNYYCSSHPQCLLRLDMGKTALVNRFSIEATLEYYPKGHPKKFTLEGSHNGVDFEVISRYDHQTDWKVGEVREFKCPMANFQYYQLNVLENNGENSYTVIGQLCFSYKESILLKIEEDNIDNVKKYGMIDILIPHYFDTEKYISKNNNKDIKKIQTHRKPLSIRLELQ